VPKKKTENKETTTVKNTQGENAETKIKEKKVKTLKAKKETKVAESKTTETKHSETKKSSTKTHETKQHENKSEETKPSENKTSETKKAPVTQPEINIGMIGHVDHGKTSLTKALTGKWCDTHSEEMKRGISIRLGYADATFYKLKTPSGTIYSLKSDEGEVIGKRIVSFVDAPGHETLMTTMLSGAALMNGAVLVIASNEKCPQPRTIEHLMALKFAGVEKIVVAQNKVDLLTREQAIANHTAIKSFLKNYGYEESPIIPVSANFGANVDLLIQAIEEHIPTKHYDPKLPSKLFVARSFDINKPGTKIKELKGGVIGGSISQGEIKIGDELELCPGFDGKKIITKVTSLSTNEGLILNARPGGLIAIGTTLDPSVTQGDRLRGIIAAKPGTMPAPTKTITMQVSLFERMLDELEEKVIIKTTEPLVLTIGTNTAVGLVTYSESGKVIVVLKNEVVVEKGEKIAVSKNINGQWRLVAFAQII